jgi:hypothetical protein
VNAGHPLPLLMPAGQVVDNLVCHPAPPLGLGYAQVEMATRA